LAVGAYSVKSVKAHLIIERAACATGRSDGARFAVQLAAVSVIVLLSRRAILCGGFSRNCHTVGYRRVSVISSSTT
jgi:hypothetical protein